MKRQSKKTKTGDKQNIKQFARKKIFVPKKQSKKQWIIASLIIVVFTVVAYIPAFKAELTNWDDKSYVLENPTLKELSVENIKTIFSEYYMGNYHPLAMLSLSLDYKIGGETQDGEIRAWIYHFTNILLHIINSLLVFYFVFLLIRRFDIAFLAGLMFAVNTLHVESVAWVSERKDVLYALFFIASLIEYLYYIDKKQIKFYFLSLLLFILSLLSKGQAVSLAVSLLAIDFLYDRKLLDKKVIFEKIPYFILALIFGIIAIYAQKEGNALHGEESYAFYKRIGFAGYAFTQYIIKLFVPINLSAIYPYPDIINKTVPGYYWLFLIPSLSILYLFFYFLKRNKIYAFAIAFFIINIVLLLQLIPVGSAIMADRYAYIPSIGFFIFLAYFLHNLMDKYPKQALTAKLFIAIYIIFLMVLSFNRCKVWNNSMSLWDDTIEKSPTAVVALNNRGSTKDRNKDHRGAIKDFTKAIIYKPDYKHAFYNRGMARKELAKETGDTSLFRPAITDFDKALKFDEYFVEAYHSRAVTKENYADYITNQEQRKQLLLQALEDYDKALKINPEYEEALVNRGVAKGKLGMLNQAIEDFNQALLINPNNPSIYSNRGLAKDHAKNYEAAIADYNKAIELDPEFITAYLNRGLAYQKIGKLEKAIEDFSKVIALDNQNAAAYYFRGIDLIKLNRLQEACKDLHIAQNLNYVYAKNAIEQYCK
ncbi:MAG: tetratricopeptide repeat protein [Bacteroidales bacterium]|nr:tetratricopeptide repeat protein [Bacteroidales bacterium]